MRVVFVLTQARGGPADLTVGLARTLGARPGGPEVMVMGPGSLDLAGMPDGLLHPVTVRSKLDARGYADIAQQLKDLAPDIVHAQDHRAALVSCLVAGRVPLVLTFHGVPDSAAGHWVGRGPWRGRPAGAKGRSRMIAQGLVSRRAIRTIAPSQAIARFLRRELRVPERRLRVLPNGVSLPQRPLRQSCQQVRTFTTVSNFAPCKATPLLVQAFAAMARGRPDIRLRMIGDGRDRARCEELARETNGQVEFTGYRSDVYAELGRADAFVLPSPNENMPLALLQAMATGLPCIASDVGGVPEVVDEQCGVLVAPGDEQALRAAMEHLVADPGLAGRLGSAARHRVEDQFSLERCADNYVRLWTELTSG